MSLEFLGAHAGQALHLAQVRGEDTRCGRLLECGHELFGGGGECVEGIGVEHEWAGESRGEFARQYPGMWVA